MLAWLVNTLVGSKATPWAPSCQAENVGYAKSCLFATKVVILTTPFGHTLNLPGQICFVCCLIWTFSNLGNFDCGLGKLMMASIVKLKEWIITYLMACRLYYQIIVLFMLPIFLQVFESYSVTSVLLWAMRVQINTLWFFVWVTEEHFKVM